LPEIPVMKYLEGFDRQQTIMEVDCPENWVEKNSDVRKIDAFVHGLDMAALGFRTDYGENGRPAYHPADLLKLYLYGYMNRTRSSRALERECVRNLEVRWLMRGLKPDHNTIANFRKDNPEAITRAFAASVLTAKQHGLIGGTLLAGDSTKFRAQNSRKNNFNPKKVEKHIEYIDKKLREYQDQLAEEDGDSPRGEELKKKIENKKEQRIKYEKIGKELERTGANQISTSDPDSRMMITRGINTEVCYNAQTTVDEKNKLIIDFKTTNEKDDNAMGDMLDRACDVLDDCRFTALYDKGYYNGEELQKAEELGPEVMVAIPEASSHAPDPDFDLKHFTYNEKEDIYICPAGNELTTNGTAHEKKSGKHSTLVRHYKTTACGTCPLKSQCTRNAKGRTIERSQHAHLYEQNKQRIEANPELYRQRQQIVEHPFGTIKRQWGFDHIMTKRGLDRASADLGLIFLAYNLRRMFNILGKEKNPGNTNPNNDPLSALFGFIRATFHIPNFYKQFLNFSSPPPNDSSKRPILAQ
jgi:transposase